ncbi:MAG: hypothetical protein FWH55_08265 [Oscillospiraceae bacterium]|nr:hypothetical protein [Oscillospiraceae bacterium]
MKKNVLFKSLAMGLAIVLMVALITPVASAAPAASTASSGSLGASFADPQGGSKMRIRCWWPDAGATDEEIRKEVREIAAAGFGGIEQIAIGTPDDAATLGWGTDRWFEAMQVVLEEAEKENVMVDATIGPRWPAGVPGLDPNTDTAQRKLIHSSKAISIPPNGGSLFDLPDIPNLSPTAAVNKYEFVALVAAKYTSLTTTISGSAVTRNVTIDESTLEIVPATGVDLDMGRFEFNKPAGGDYIFFAFWAIGLGQAAGSTSPTAYVVNHFNTEGASATLDLWQGMFDKYPKIADHFKQYGGSFFVDSLEMTNADIYWSNATRENFRNKYNYDLVQYLPLIVRKWSANETNALIATTAIAETTGANTITAGANYTLAENITPSVNPNAGNEVSLDYINNQNDMFNKNHIAQIQAWCEKYNMNLRMQVQPTSGKGWSDALASHMYVGIPEGESLGMSSHPDAFRSVAGAANMSGKTGIVSVEYGADVAGAYRMTWQRLVEILNRTASAGVNQWVLHGYPTLAKYTRSEAWPSWHAFSTMFAEAWNHQNPAWEHMPAFTNYVSRMQVALQYGAPSVDFAVYRSNVGNGYYIDSKPRAGSAKDSGNLDPQQIYDYYVADYDNATGFVDDVGYTYNYISPASFDFPSGRLENGVLNPGFAGYKALVIKDVTAMDLSAAQSILAYAKAGLPIVLIGKTPDTGGATNIDKNYLTNNDALIISIFQELKTLANVKAVADPEALKGALADLDVKPDASYESANIASVHRQTDDLDLYYLYNNSTTRDYETSDFTHDNGASENLYHDPSKAISTTVTLNGNGKPYNLDPWTGEIKPIVVYTVNSNGTISIPLTILDCEAKLIAITDNEGLIGDFGAPDVVNNSAGGELVYGDGKVSFRATDDASYDVQINGYRNAGSVSAVTAPFSLDTGWALDVESWERGPLALLPNNDPAQNLRDVAIVNMPYTNVDLLSWRTLSPDLAMVSGRGKYTKTFNLSGNFTGAYVDLGKTYCDILEVKINGHILPPVDQYNLILDLGPYVKEGANTIEVYIATPMELALRAAGRNITSNWCVAYTFGANADYGLLGDATITPYVDVVLWARDRVLADIRSDDASVAVNSPASYTVSLENAKGAGVVTLSFTADSRYLDLASATALNGFTILDPLAMEYVGGQMWKGTVKLYCPNFVQSNDPLDVLRINGVTSDLSGDTTVALTGFIATGDAQGYSGAMSCAIRTAEAVTSIVTKTVFSKYDLNHDGRIDELDLAIVVYYYLANDLEADWDVVKFDIASARDCDVAVNGRVDLADMIEVIANYCDSY